MMTPTLFWTTRTDVLRHLFKNFVRSPHLFVLERLSVLKHKSHESEIFVLVPVAFGLGAVDSSLPFLQAFTFLSFDALTVFMTDSTMRADFGFKRRLLLFSFSFLGGFVIASVHCCSQKYISFHLLKMEPFGHFQPKEYIDSSFFQFKS